MYRAAFPGRKEAPPPTLSSVFIRPCNNCFSRIQLRNCFISLILGKNCFGSVLRASQGTDSSSQVCDTNSIFQPLFNWSVFLLCWFLTNGGCEVSNPRLQGQRLLCAVSRDVVMCCMYFKWRRKSIWTSTKFDCRHVQKNSLLSFSYCECKSW